MRHFDEMLEELLQKVVVMGNLAEQMIELAMRGLNERNLSLAATCLDKEREVNSLQVEVDDKAVKLTALQQPVAADVRFVFMASRISGELERVADQAVNICQNTHYVLEGPPIKPLVDLPIMAQVAQRMLRNSIIAVSKRDATLAEAVLNDEDTVDAFRDQIFRILLTHMMGDPRTIQQAMSLILISRNLERIGDHATNIAEEIIYWIQGRDVRHQKPSRLPGNDASPQDGVAQAAIGEGPTQ